MTLIDAAYEQTTRDDGTVVAWLRNVHVTHELSRRSDALPLDSSGGYAVVVYDPATDTIGSVQAPLGFTQAKEAYRSRQ